MHSIRKFAFVLSLLVVLSSPSSPLIAQSQKPLTSKEVVSWLYQLPRYPEKRDELVDEIRKRGIGFPLTDGMRSLVATKSGNDALLRRTLEEAERRRVNPTASTLPSATEGNELLERTRNVTLAAANAMPDFIVRQLIRRSVAYGTTTNWIPQDTLSIAVGYRANQGEEYKLLAINGTPASAEVQQSSDYSKYAGGSTSHGVEYISAQADIFRPESQTEFKMVDTDVLQGRRTIVYEYTVKKEQSRLTLIEGNTKASATVGSRGRLWIDRELDRVVRFEQIATEIPSGFPISAASSLIDYDWVTINDHKYLLPFHSEILITSVRPQAVLQSRNDVRFRSYQKFGAELKVIDEVGEDDEPADQAPPPPKPKPIKPPM
ncbi:MAG TPA: hypothetical protein VGQ39_23590 [Pyrinomonadaceae bacterium]|jgi:hypothetical protein|nr:hypothetical protein [Pyrinomonadaceae bacterium]